MKDYHEDFADALKYELAKQLGAEIMVNAKWYEKLWWRIRAILRLP